MRRAPRAAAPTRANFMNASSNSPRRMRQAIRTRPGSGAALRPRVCRGRLPGSAVTTNARARDPNAASTARCRGAMPYHRQRRQGCKVVPAHHSPFASGWLFEPHVARLPSSRSAARRGAARSEPVRQWQPSRLPAASLHEVRLRRGVHDPSGPHHGHRPAGRHRPLGDDRVGLAARSTPRTCFGSCVYLPHASVLVAEARRELVGGALLVLRPSVTAGGYVGAVDFLVVAPDHDADRVTESLLEELLRSASNKGCSTVEASEPSDPADLARLERAGFAPAGVDAPATPSSAAGSEPAAPSAPALRSTGPGSNHIGVTVGKNVAVFVDVANIFYAAKAAGVDIDYVTLLKSATAGRDFVRAYAYTGLDPDNENQRNFHQFLARHQYKVVSKDIRKYGDGKVKANLDIELVVDMMKTARNLDVAVIVSGDGDFAPAIRAVQEMGVRVEVISFRGNTSSDLIEVADLFTDIAHIAKVDKSSTRSGRRVAEDDDEDLSMTEVPDKMTEGTGRGRGRGRGRGGRYERDEAPVAARSGRTRSEVPHGRRRRIRRRGARRPAGREAVARRRPR